jgi:hypothetical protein
MKKTIILESAIIGFFVGVVVSAYLTFLTGTGKILGHFLTWISLKPVLFSLPVQYKDSLFYNFLFFVFIFIIYGIIIGILIQRSKKIVILILIILLIIVFWEQQKISNKMQNPTDADTAQSTNIIIPNKKIKQYFGNEALGDLNNDGKDDVAFIIKRNDDDGEGDMFYLTSAIQIDEGKLGTNLIYLGGNLEVQKIAIENNLIKIDYSTKDVDEITGEDITKSQTFYASIEEGKLKETIATSTEDVQD